MTAMGDTIATGVLGILALWITICRRRDMEDGKGG
jgi:hypothetical protein